MTVLADLSADDQDVLFAGMRSAAVAVSAASPGRGEETASEGFEAAKLVLDSQPRYVDNPLVTSVIVEIGRRIAAEQPFQNYLEIAQAAGAGEQARTALRAVAALLDEHVAPDEAGGFKRWLVEIATTTAKAGKEDQGFLGMGGVMVNDAERTALKEIASILGIAADQPA
jgi:hypothetical protein